MPTQIGFMAEDKLYKRIVEFRFKNHMNSMKDVMHYLLKHALDDLEKKKIKNDA